MLSNLEAQDVTLDGILSRVHQPYNGMNGSTPGICSTVRENRLDRCGRDGPPLLLIDLVSMGCLGH